MEKLTLRDFDEAYRLFENAFDPAELRPYEKMKLFFLEEEFVLYGLRNDDQLIGVLTVWEFEDFIYLENFAVDESLRGQGIGQRFLTETKDLYPNQLIVLEVEEPRDELTHRRIHFYERNQFILNPYHFIQPALRANANRVDLMLMSYPEAISVYTFDRLKKQLFRVVYQQGI